MRRLTCLTLASAAVFLSLASSPDAADSPNSNLLSYANGAIIRSYTPGLTDVGLITQDGGSGMDEGVKGSVQIVWEMPGVAVLKELSVLLEAGAKATLAVSTTSATDGFHDIGTAQGDGSTTAATIAGAAGVKARWVRAIAAVVSTQPPIVQIKATGALAPRPPGAPGITGDYWAFRDKLYADGKPLIRPQGEQPERLEVTQIGDGANGLQCSAGSFSQAFPGKLAGRVWTYDTEYAGNDSHSTLIVNDEGTLLVGADAGGVDMVAFSRTAGGALPPFCGATTVGSGPAKALLLQSPHWDANYPDEDSLAAFKGHALTIAGVSLLTPAMLTGVDIAALNGVCRPKYLINADQSAALMSWVAAGHKLLITDSDMCGEPVPYDFLPYKFKSDNPGAKGEPGHTLVVVENNSLGSADKADPAHFVDATAYANDPNNQLGDANTVYTQDDHWCGHLFGVNASGVNGFMEMYAFHGKGLLLYNGFDVDDASISQYQTVRQLEYAAPIPTDLPCSRKVDMGFVIVQDEARSFVPGTAATITVPMRVLSNREWKGHVTLTAAGDFPATVTPSFADLPPGDHAISVAVSVPTTAKAGHYAVIVTGSAGTQSAAATITLTSAETSSALKTALASGCTVPVYGVNFDFNKTTLRPDAEPVLQQILALFKSDPSLDAEIGGHTDNIGTSAYNMTLSAGRADAVKTWLVAHGIVASRISTHGYGDTVPLVPNDSDANRARNRRVEIKKPNCGK